MIVKGLHERAGGGSASLPTSITGTKVSELRYLPYGETRWAWGVTPTDRRFTGQRELTGVGLYDYNARMYWPAAGRFVSADTVVPGPENPQAFNRYAYVLGNPLRLTDSTGHCPSGDQDCLDQVDKLGKKMGYEPDGIRDDEEWTTSKLMMLLAWIADGVSFVGGSGFRVIDDGPKWTGADLDVVLTALQRVNEALAPYAGGKLLFGVEGEAGIAFVKSSVPDAEIYGAADVGLVFLFKLSDATFQFEYQVETAVHELGHIVDLHAGLGRGQWSVTSGEWSEAAWGIRLDYSRPTAYAGVNAKEDFAETFTWLVEKQWGGYQNRGLGSQAPDRVRQAALMHALSLTCGPLH